MYRLSGVDGDDDDGEVKEDDLKVSPESTVATTTAPNDEFFQGDWPAQFSISEFQPAQFFPNWEEPAETTKEVVNPNTSNGHHHSKDDVCVLIFEVLIDFLFVFFLLILQQRKK